MAGGKAHTYLRRLGVPNGERSEVIRVESIDRIESEGKYVRIWTEGRSHLLRRPISLLEKVLDPSVFVRVSRSAIVNVDRITQIIQPTPRECYVALGASVRIKVTRGYERAITRLMFDVE
jgi:two-component system LytT family response regulator